MPAVAEPTSRKGRWLGWTTAHPADRSNRLWTVSENASNELSRRWALGRLSPETWHRLWALYQASTRDIRDRHLWPGFESESYWTGALPARSVAFRENLAVRVVTWNLYNRGVAGARLQGELLRKLSPDLMLLQEVISARLKLSARRLALTG